MKLTSLASVASLLALAGCSGLTDAPILSSTDTQRYTPYSNAAFVGNGQLELVGSAQDPATRAALAQVAVLGISDGAFGGKFRLKPSDEVQSPARNRVVVAIGGGNSWELCTNPPVRGGAFFGQFLRVSAAACNGTTRLSSTNAQISGLKGVNDLALQRFFAQVGAALFPGRNIDYLLRDQDFDF